MKTLRVLGRIASIAFFAGLSAYRAQAETNRTRPAGNSIGIIVPYWHGRTWVFDDPAKGIQKEPFVEGIPEMIDHLVRDIPDARNGFRMLFSAAPFPNHQMEITFVNEEAGGAYYFSPALQKKGWLCPVLFQYFPTPPKSIFVKGEPLERGANSPREGEDKPPK